MQNILPVLCFIAGFGLAWLVLRRRSREVEAACIEITRNAMEQSQRTAQGELAAVVSPVRESLDRVDAQIHQLETARAGAYCALQEQVRSLIETQSQLRSETGKLVTALRTPHVRGNWGEVQLRRVVEMAGMLDHCDFTTQRSIQGEERRLRPDLLVRLPAGRTIVVDAKTPLDAYLRAIEAPDEATRKARMA